MAIFDIPIHTSSQSVDRVLNAGLPVLLVLERDQCAPCRQLDPALDTLAGEFAGQLLVARIDVENDPDLLSRFAVDALPGLVFLKGGKRVATATGAASLAALQQWAAYLISGGERPALPSGPSLSLRPGAPSPSPAAATAPAEGKPIPLGDANFEQIINGELPVLVDFWAPWCGPCHRVAPVVEALAGEFAGKLVVGKLNVDENQRIAGRYNVMSIPTLIIFRQGKIVDQVVGALPHHILRQRVLPHVH